MATKGVAAIAPEMVGAVELGCSAPCVFVAVVVGCAVTFETLEKPS